LNSKAYYYDM